MRWMHLPCENQSFQCLIPIANPITRESKVKFKWCCVQAMLMISSYQISVKCQRLDRLGRPHAVHSMACHRWSWVFLIILCHQRGHSKKDGELRTMRKWVTMLYYAAMIRKVWIPWDPPRKRLSKDLLKISNVSLHLNRTSWELNVPLPSRTGTKDFMKDKAPDTQQAQPAQLLDFVLLQFHISQCSHKCTSGKWR